MLAQLRSAIVALLALTLVTGVAYPLIVTGIAKVAFAKQASGSLISRDGVVIGSTLIGQSFSDPKYFWGRLSATVDANAKALPYNAGASGGSNLGPLNPALAEAAKARAEALRAADPTNTAPIPIDLVTASASGLDPHVSPAAALYQVGRVARTRGLDEARVRALVTTHTEPGTFGVLGEARVNVLALNLALDAIASTPH
jgi:K+-transporting ATPase ATPase C chain